MKGTSNDLQYDTDNPGGSDCDGLFASVSWR